MKDRLTALGTEFAEVERQLADPAVFEDQDRYQDLARRHKELEAIVTASRTLREREDDAEAAKELLADAAGDERDLLRSEQAEAEADIARLNDEIRILLLPRDPNDDRDAIVEIRGAEGGEEANLFAADLFQMYQGFASRHGWSIEVLDAERTDRGGFAAITFVLAGDGVWTRMKHEGGPHRVQRVPVTESQGRVHTSSATVTVLPRADEVEVAIDPNELDIDYYRSSGPGGQSVNTTDSAVRITHRPTGVVVSMQDQKSQLQNRVKAMEVLASRLLKLEQDRQAEARSDARRDQTGGGGRAEKIRTYNFKDNRVSDHRIGLTVHNLDRILQGGLDEVSDALVQDEQTRRLTEDP